MHTTEECFKSGIEHQPHVQLITYSIVAILSGCYYLNVEIIEVK
jgi:hypothetical protein